MKKRILFVSLILAVGCIAMAQEAPDTTKVPFSYIKGMGLWDLIKANGLAVLAIIYAVAEYYLGKSGKLKEGSIPHWIFNMIGRLIFKKAELIKTKETNRALLLDRKAAEAFDKKRHAPVSKILIVAVILSGLSLSLSAQQKHPLRIYPFMKSQPVELRGITNPQVDSTFFFGASVATELFTKEIKSGESAFGVMPGAGFGLKWNPKWNPIKTKSFLSLDLFAQAKQSKDEFIDQETATGITSKYFDIKLTPMLGIFDWIRAGYGPLFRIGTNKNSQGYVDWVFSISIATTI